MNPYERLTTNSSKIKWFLSAFDKTPSRPKSLIPQSVPTCSSHVFEMLNSRLGITDNPSVTEKLFDVILTSENPMIKDQVTKLLVMAKMVLDDDEIAPVTEQKEIIRKIEKRNIQIQLENERANLEYIKRVSEHNQKLCEHQVEIAKLWNPIIDSIIDDVRDNQVDKNIWSKLGLQVLRRNDMVKATNPVALITELESIKLSEEIQSSYDNNVLRRCHSIMDLIVVEHKNYIMQIFDSQCEKLRKLSRYKKRFAELDEMFYDRTGEFTFLADGDFDMRIDDFETYRRHKESYASIMREAEIVESSIRHEARLYIKALHKSGAQGFETIHDLDTIDEEY